MHTDGQGDEAFVVADMPLRPRLRPHRMLPAVNRGPGDQPLVIAPRLRMGGYGDWPAAGDVAVTGAVGARLRRAQTREPIPLEQCARLLRDNG